MSRRGRHSLRIVISAGSTREPIDPVRFVSNYSTGFMGRCLAVEALRRGHRVTVVSGPVSVAFPAGVRVLPVERARQMQARLRREAPKADAIIMAAAVCDFAPLKPRRVKLARAGRLRLELRATPDIIGALPRRPGQVVAGFALETAEVLRRARTKLARKRLDLLVAQRMNGHSSPFGPKPVLAWLLDASGRVRPLGTAAKPRVARLLLDEIERVWYGEQRVGDPFRAKRAGVLSSAATAR